MPLSVPTTRCCLGPPSAAASSCGTTASAPPPLPPSRAASMRARKRTESAIESDAGLVVARARVDSDGVAGIDKERHVYDQAALERCGLARAALRVAGKAGLGFDDLQVDRYGQFDADRLALVGGAIEHHPVGHVQRRVA